MRANRISMPKGRARLCRAGTTSWELSTRNTAGSLLVVVFASACGGGSSASPGASTPDYSTQVAAVRQTVAQSPQCQSISPFYYEIGNATAAITGASVGGSYSATSAMNIASSTKWLFGAYVAQIRAGALTPSDLRATRMQLGYVSMGALACDATMTVQSCFDTPPNNTYTAARLDRFNYGGGHFQKWSVDNGLGPLTSAALASEFRNKLGDDIGLQFGPPQPAGGGIASASDYAVFLRKILSGQLHIAALLGAQKVCTLPGVCATADDSPIAENWSYSIGHWVEDAPDTGDGAFSSAGAFGFYPWIDASKTYYGVIARAAVTNGAARASAQCGRKLRQAFATGEAQ